MDSLFSHMFFPLITKPTTRLTANSATLIDNIFTSVQFSGIIIFIYLFIFFMQETFNLQNTILQTLLTMQVSLRYSTYRTILTLLTMRVTYADNTILNTVTYRKYNYLHYGLLTLLIIQYSTYITC